MTSPVFILENTRVTLPGAQWAARIGGERAGGEHGKAGQRQALGAAYADPGCGITIGPIGSGAGVQEVIDFIVQRGLLVAA